MLKALGASVDRRIANAILARAERRWPPLRLVPVAWMRPLLKPAGTLIRREVAWTAAPMIAVVGLLVALVLLGAGW
jgi:hypothetical protein